MLLSASELGDAGEPPLPKTWGLEHGDHAGAHGHGAGWVPGQIQGKGKGAARNKGILRLC